MAFTFIKANGGEIGSSPYESSLIEDARAILNKANQLKKEVFLPLDVLSGNAFNESAKEKVFEINKIEKGWMGMDIYSKTISVFEKAIMSSNTILWNGPVGVFEKEKFSYGTKQICEIL